MHSHLDRAQENQAGLVANGSVQRKRSGAATLHFDDHRPAAATQRKVQEMADNSRQAMQLKAFQGVARGTYPTHGAGEGPLQRKALVYVHTNNADKKAIVSRGKVEDFKNGTNAGTKGWVGVKSYRARYQIDSEDEEYQNKNSVGPLQNDFTNPESGHVLGKQNGGDGADPENVFGQDGGTNNGVYKSFEIDMRKKLDLYDDEDDVGFVSYLAGDDIKQGTIADEGLSDAGSISSEDDLW